MKLADIARASGNIQAFEVEDRDGLADTLQEAMDVVRSGRPAVVDVRITPFSHQVLGKDDTRPPS